MLSGPTRDLLAMTETFDPPETKWMEEIQKTETTYLAGLDRYRSRSFGFMEGRTEDELKTARCREKPQH